MTEKAQEPTVECLVRVTCQYAVTRKNQRKSLESENRGWEYPLSCGSMQRGNPARDVRGHVIRHIINTEIMPWQPSVQLCV